MKLAIKRESGQIIILVLILLALGPLLVVPMLNQSISSQKYHRIIETNTLTAYAADAGIEYGYCEVYNNPEDIQTSPLEEILYINNATVNVTAEYVPSMAAYRITSTATSTDNKSITIESYVIIEIGLFGNAFACDGNLEIYNTDLTSDEPGECDVYANGNVLLNNSSVDGDLYAAGNITLKNSDVTGDIVEGATVLDFPPIDPAPHEEAAKEGGTSGDVRLKGGGPYSLGPLYIDGNLDITNADVTLEGTLYVTGDVDINNATISGFGDIVAEGNISLTNYKFYVDDPDTLPLVMSINLKIDLTNDEGDPGTEAVLYAPNDEILLSNVNVYGSVAAKTIVVSNSQIFYPASLKGRPDLPGAGLETITYGYK